MSRAAKKPKDDPTENKKAGRPSAFTPVLAERVCEKVAEGLGVEKVGKLPGFPSSTTIYRWLAKEGTEFAAFREKYARACESRAGARFEKMRQWADDTAEGRMDPTAARAAADIEKWCLGREYPRKYGDAITLKGDKNNPLRVKASEFTEAELLAIAAGEAALDG